MILAMIGCSFQLQSTLINYFKYLTITRTTYVYYFDTMDLMSISICIPYVDIIDYQKLKNVKKVNLIPLTRNDRAEKLQELLSIRNIFDLTLSNDTLLSSCALRSKTPRVMTKYDSNNECNQFFGVKKYFSQEFMCYFISPNQYQIPYYSTYSSIDSSNVVYKIGVTDPFSSKVKYIRFIVHSNSSLPGISKRFSPVIKPSSMKSFKLTYVKIFMERLGYPYGGFICADKSHIYYDCVESCAMNKSIESFGKILYDTDTYHKYDQKHVSKRDAVDPIISNKIYDIYSFCWKKCSTYKCKVDYAITSQTSDVSDHMEVALDCPSFPYLWVVYYPRIELLDVTVYIMGAIGAWFGISFIHLNPLAIVIYIRKKPTNDPDLDRSTLSHHHAYTRFRLVVSKHHHRLNRVEELLFGFDNHN